MEVVEVELRDAYAFGKQAVNYCTANKLSLRRNFSKQFEGIYC